MGTFTVTHEIDGKPVEPQSERAYYQVEAVCREADSLLAPLTPFVEPDARDLYYKALGAIRALATYHHLVAENIARYEPATCVSGDGHELRKPDDQTLAAARGEQVHVLTEARRRLRSRS